MKKLKIFTRIIIAVCALAMIPSNFVSVWQIQLEAPQYPEGLKMEIWSHKIAGDIDKINGLNHYIGMSQIKEENFPEFKIMPWMIWGFVVIGLATAIVGRRFMLWIFTSVLVASGVWGIYDFWHWEYEYGHNLDPHAAIKLPGMTYQPPLFGWKQLLNFLAGSFPDVGGYLIIVPAFLVVALLMYEMFRRHQTSDTRHETKKSNHRHGATLFLSCVLCLGSCLCSCNTGPVKINFGHDNCEFCKMTIMDKKFGGELINKKGKTVKFDSGECMVSYIETDKKFEADKILVVNFANPEELIEADKSFFLHGGNVNSPMGGQLAAFKTREDAEKFQKELQGDLLLWADVSQISF